MGSDAYKDCKFYIVIREPVDEELEALTAEDIFLTTAPIEDN